MNDIPEHLKYAKTHEWVNVLDNRQLQVGITDFAQQALGDLVYVELPEIGRKLDVNEVCAVVESVKAASDLYSPVTGQVVAINQQVIDDPACLNEAPYTHWLFTLTLENPEELASLMDANAYQTVIDE